MRTLLGKTVLQTDSTNSRTSRVELILVIAITLIAGLVRCVGLDEIAIEHFDEGVYASNLWFPDSGFKYPDQHLYAPPLVPSLIEWSTLIFGETSWAPFFPSLLLGTLTVPLVWFVGRGWFGAPAGVAASCLVALSDFHIAMSRSALTDITMCFFLIAACGMLHVAVTQHRFGLSLLAGVFTGLCWSAKYNGWLALAIAVSGTAAALLAATYWLKSSASASDSTSTAAKKRTNEEPNITVTWTRATKHLALMVVVACVVWYPTYNGLAERGGYSIVAKNHQQYVVGFSGWWPSFVQQESVQRHYAGWMTWLSGMLSVACAYLVSRSTWNDDKTASAAPTDESPNANRSTWNAPVSLARVSFVMVLTGAIVLSPLLVFLVWSFTTLLSSLLGLRRSASSASSPVDQLTEPASMRWLAIWLSLAWMMGLLLATPMYRPYPRLLLPLLSVGWIVTGSASVLLLFGRSSENRQSSSNMRWLTIVLVLAVCGWRSYRMGFRCWQDRSGLATIAELAIEEASVESMKNPSDRADVQFVVYVYGEPGLFFHVPRDGVPAQPIQDLNFAKPGSDHPRIPTFLLVGPHARKSIVFQDQLRDVRDQLQLIKSYNYRASDFVLLDDFNPSELAKTGPARVVLYRVLFE
jgi:hypothetical protein